VPPSVSLRESTVPLAPASMASEPLTAFI
jgi:hypothetical protein